MLTECYRLFWVGMLIGIACGIFLDIIVFSVIKPMFNSASCDFAAHKIERFRAEIENDEIHMP